MWIVHTNFNTVQIIKNKQHVQLSDNYDLTFILKYSKTEFIDTRLPDYQNNTVQKSLQNLKTIMNIFIYTAMYISFTLLLLK